jgi:hypothetical protein
MSRTMKTRNHLAAVGQWLALLALALFVASFCYFFLLMGGGSINKNPLRDQVVALHNHGTTVFVTQYQYGAWIGSLILACAFFTAGNVIFGKGRKA